MAPNASGTIRGWMATDANAPPILLEGTAKVSFQLSFLTSHNETPNIESAKNFKETTYPSKFVDFRSFIFQISQF